MKIDDALQELLAFRSAIGKERPVMSFEVEVIHPTDERQGPFRKCFKKEIPADGAQKESGVYFICDLDETILYIGKAAANNLAAEIWGKFSAATEISETSSARFGNSSLAEWAPSYELRDLIISGDVVIRAAIIRPQEFASLAEVYLQTWCLRNGGLPALNKCIG